MSRRSLTILASFFALVLTVCAWWQVMLYKVPPPGKLALWLPFIVLLQTSDGVPILIALFQFPVLAVIFVLASRRFSAWAVLAIMLVLYALCSWGAYHMLQTHHWA